jgi:hypothetical protein
MVMEPMLDLPYGQIRRTARGALRAAGIDADTPLPIPLGDIAAAAGLQREALYDLGEQEDVPPGLLKIFKKMKRSVLGALSAPERRIYIDSGMSSERARFTEGHEIGHDAMPWHHDAYFGDSQYTLDRHAEAGLESEANAFSAELLFGLDRFTEQADDYKPSLSVPLGLNGLYETSAQATVRRYVERTGHEVALIVTGRYPTRPGAASVPVWEKYQSQSFFHRFGPIAQSIGGHLTLSTYPSVHELFTETAGPVTECVMVLNTTRGMTRFVAEGFSNGRVGMVLVRRNKMTLGRKLELINADGSPLR